MAKARPVHFFQTYFQLLMFRPHVHFLGIFNSDDKPKCPAHFDALASAEIPDPQKCPDLHAKVEAYMLHRKCGKFFEKIIFQF